MPSSPSISARLLAIAVAATVSGAPSTLVALHKKTPITGAARAAGALLGRQSMARGIAAHTMVSLGWGMVLTTLLPRGRRTATGVLAGAAIGVLDLGLVGRHLPGIRDLELGPQLLDHIAFGGALGLTLDLLEAAGGIEPPYGALQAPA